MKTIKAVPAEEFVTPQDHVAEQIRERIDQDTLGWIETMLRERDVHGAKACLGDVERAMHRRRALHRSVDWLRNYLA